MIAVLTALLVLGGLVHVAVQVYNRWLITLPDGPFKFPLHALWFLTVTVLPAVLMVLGWNWPPLQDALQWDPVGVVSQILFASFGALWLVGVWRGASWVWDRFAPPHSTQVVSEQLRLPTIRKPKHGLPRILSRWETTFDLEVVEREIVVPNLAAEFDGLTIAHVADIHFESRRRWPLYFHQVADIVNDWSPEVVAFTGDFITRGAVIAPSVEFHATMRGRLATLAVLGNHDYWTSPHRVREECRRHGIRLMHNRRWTIERAGRSLTFAGTDEPWGGTRSPFGRLVRPRVGEAVILLSHTPDNAPRAAAEGANLVLSGHNHGGQFCFPLIGPIVVPARSGHRFAHGVYDVGPDCVLQVSRGIGSSFRGPTGGRLLCPPELILLRLRSPHCDVPVRVAQPTRLRRTAIARGTVALSRSMRAARTLLLAATVGLVATSARAELVNLQSVEPLPDLLSNGTLRAVQLADEMAFIEPTSHMIHGPKDFHVYEPAGAEARLVSGGTVEFVDDGTTLTATVYPGIEGSGTFRIGEVEFALEHHFSPDGRQTLELAPLLEPDAAPAPITRSVVLRMPNTWLPQVVLVDETRIAYFTDAESPARAYGFAPRDVETWIHAGTLDLSQRHELTVIRGDLRRDGFVKGFRGDLATIATLADELAPHAIGALMSDFLSQIDATALNPERVGPRLAPLEKRVAEFATAVWEADDLSTPVKQAAVARLIGFSVVELPVAGATAPDAKRVRLGFQLRSSPVLHGTAVLVPSSGEVQPVEPQALPGDIATDWGELQWTVSPRDAQWEARINLDWHDQVFDFVIPATVRP